MLPIRTRKKLKQKSDKVKHFFISEMKKKKEKKETIKLTSEKENLVPRVSQLFRGESWARERRRQRDHGNVFLLRSEVLSRVHTKC